MMNDAKRREVPILFIRFEDLVLDPEPQLYNLMRFMLGQKDLTGTNAERRIKEVIAMGHSATKTYSLKESTKKNNANAHRYTPELKNWVGENLKEFINFFGYSKLPGQAENLTGFFDYENPDAEMIRQHGGFAN